MGNVVDGVEDLRHAISTLVTLKSDITDEDILIDLNTAIGALELAIKIEYFNSIPN